MEFEYSVWQISIIALIAGAMIGALVYRLLSPSVKQAGKIHSELRAAREELNNYKAGVTQHFDKTAELVNDLAQNYVKVYQHLAEGAKTLGASKSFKDLIEQHQGKASLPVDNQPKVAAIVDDGLVVDPVIGQEKTMEAPIDYAEPPTEANTDGADPVAPENDVTKTDEPVVEAESADIDKRPDAVGDLPDGEEKIDNKGQTAIN